MESKIELNISMLSSILQINSIDIKTLRENQAKNDYYKTLPYYSPLLLTIAYNYNKEFPEEICLNAAIQLKNYISSYWPNPEGKKPINNKENEYIIINEEDKKYIRIKILEAVIYVVHIENIKILKQLNQCVKYILNNDFREKNINYNKDFINKILECLNSKDLKQTYAGIILFYQLSKIFEFDNDDNQKIYEQELIKVNSYLLSSLYECKDINNLIQAQFAYKIIKIFFKSFQGAIPQLFTQENIFAQWINYIIKIIKVPINQENINNNIIINNSNRNIFIKLKRVCYQTITRIIQKFSRYSSKNDKTPFEIMISNKYINTFFEIYQTIFSKCFNNLQFLDDYGKTCIYNFFSILMENDDKNSSKNVISMFINDNNNELLNYIINDSFLSCEDLELYESDPKKYLAEKVELMSSLLTKRYNSCKLFSSLFSYTEKKKEQPNYCRTLFDFLCKCLITEENKLNNEKQYLMNNKEPYYLIYNKITYCLRKESILYLLIDNKSIIKKYLKKDFENLLESIVYPELNSPCGFLREQVCAFIKALKGFKYTNKFFVEKLTKSFSYLMQNDAVLPIRFESSMALCSILDEKNAKELIKGNIQILLQIYLKLMEETDLEEIMECLQEIVTNFTEESKIYIVELSEYLINYFNKLIVNINNNEDQENQIDDFSLINNIINTFSNFIHYFINNDNIYPKIEKHIDTLLNYCIIEQPFDKLEDGINLLEEILINCKILPKHIIKFFIPLINTFIGNVDNNEESDLENIMDINKLICFYLHKDEGIILSLNDKNGITYFEYIIKYMKYIINICDKNKEYCDIIYVFELYNTLFDKYKNNGKMKIILEEVLNIIFSKYEYCNQDKKLSVYLCLLLSTSFIYYPIECLQYFLNKNKLREIFLFWFLEIDNIKNHKMMKYNLFGICVLISLDKNNQNKLIIDNIKFFIDKILQLTEKISKNLLKKNKNKKEENNNDEEDDEDYDEDELYKKFLEQKEINDDEDDEDWEEEDDEEEDINFTKADKINPILYVKNIFDLIKQKHPDLFKNIINILGDDINKLSDIFNKFK